MTARRLVRGARRSGSAAALAIAVVLGAMAVLAAPVQAAPVQAAPVQAAPVHAAPAPGTATIRAAHFAPDVPPVDVYVRAGNGPLQRFATDLGYGDVSAYSRVPAGRYQVELLPHGSAATAAPLLTWSVDLAAGATYTAAGEGVGAAHQGALIRDDLTAPNSGAARVRIIQMANSAPAASVRVVGGRALVAAQAYQTVSPYLSLPSGVWPVVLSGAGPLERSQLAISAGSVYSVLVLDAQGGGIALRVVTDGVGSSLVPVAAVPAGGGGTATVVVDRPLTRSVGTSLIAGGLTLLVLLGVRWPLARRRRLATPGRHRAAA